MSDFVIACGGTGGHLAPGIALAEHLQARGYRTLLLISEKQIDSTLIAKYPQHRFERVPGAPMQVSPRGMLRFLVSQLRGLWFSMGFLRREKPKMVIGFGGFTTAAIIVAGWIFRIPVALHEANRVPGRAVRVLARFARRVYLPIGVRLDSIRSGKVRYAGLPVRAEIERLSRGESAVSFGLDPNLPTVAVLGGSQGASALNRWAENAAPRLAARGIQLIAVSGPGKKQSNVEINPGPEGPVPAVSISFCDRMAALLSSVDLVVTRSGAGTLAELVRCVVPAVMVPYPFAADDHQAANALDFSRNGAGVVVSESEIETLSTVVETLMADENRLAELRANVAWLARTNTMDLMLDDIERLAFPRTPTSSSHSRPAHA